MSNKVFKFKLSALRDVGWKYWDPIGLLPPNDRWEDYPEFANEYDSYLMKAAGKMARGESDDAITDYLIEIQSSHMGMTLQPGARQTTLRVAQKLREAQHLWMASK